MSDGIALQALDSDETLSLAEGEAADNDSPNPDNGPGILIDSLARLPEMTILDETRLAHELGVVKRTIRNMTRRGELPPPISFGGRSCWFAGRVLAHLDAAFERAEREAQRHAAKLRALTN